MSRYVAVTIATRAIAVSNAVADDLRGRTRRRVTVVLNGVDTEFFTPDFVPDSGQLRPEHNSEYPLVIYFGRLDEMKQVDHAIRAVAKANSEGHMMQLAIVGSPSVQQGYADFLRTLGNQLLGNLVHFVETVDDVRPLLRSADVAVFPGRVEGLSLGLLEAMASGCPVVAYSAAGVSEVLDHSVTGLVVPMGDWQGLAMALINIFRDPQLSTSLSQNGRIAAVKHFSLTNQVAQNIKVLSELIA